MSESTPENEDSTGNPSGSESSSEEGMITDEMLPEDLRADKNPMAQDPEESDEQSAGPAPGAGGDTGQPG